MLEGLEAVELLKSEVLIDNETFRFDSEYFKKEYIANLLTLKKCNYLKIRDVGNVKFGTTPSGANFKEYGIPFIRSQNFNHLNVELENIVFCSETFYIEKENSNVKKHDVLFAAVGATIGEVILIQDNLDKACINQNIGRVRLKNSSPHFIFTFFKTKYGQSQLMKDNTGNAQCYLNTEKINNFIIPNLSINFQLQIENLVKQAHEKLDHSKSLYSEAEAVLLEEVGLKDFEPSQENINIKSFSESFGTSGRLDAEYYQPKYEDILNKIKSQNFDRLNNIVEITKSIEPGSNNYDDEGLPFMRVSDFSKNGITETNKFLKDSFVKENKKQLDQLNPKKGTILFSKDGTVGIAYHLREDYNGITSGAILHLNLKTTGVFPEYLTLVLNSDLVQKQSERDAGGSIIQHWRVSEIENVLIPIIEKPIQEKIAEKIEKSFALKKESERLLEVAKQAVEMAIEEGEERAMGLIEKEIN